MLSQLKWGAWQLLLGRWDSGAGVISCWLPGCAVVGKCMRSRQYWKKMQCGRPVHGPALPTVLAAPRSSYVHVCLFLYVWSFCQYNFPDVQTLFKVVRILDFSWIYHRMKYSVCFIEGHDSTVNIFAIYTMITSLSYDLSYASEFLKSWW